MGKDRGWDYLNSSGEDFDFDKDNDGSWGIENADGSGSFYGTDGSWGHKNADGSASYYGADGSWGHKNADGSASYYGADGSWEYKNADGSGSYFGPDGSCDYINEDESGSFHGNDGEAEFIDSSDADSDEDESYEASSSGGSILGILLGVGLAAYGISKLAKAPSSSSYDDNEDYESIRDPNIQKYATWAKPASKDTTNEAAYSSENMAQTIKQIRKNKWGCFKRKIKSFLITVFICFLLVLTAYFGFKYWKYTKGIEVGILSTEAIDVEYSNVQTKLEAAGFTNIRVEVVKDLDIKEQDKENMVASISIDGHDVFTDTDKYPYDSPVIIVYHSLKEACPPTTAKKAKKMNYLELKELFTDAGFTSIRFEKQEDLITGWITKDGSVESVTINGESDFSESVSYRIDAEVVIVYHTFSE